MLFGCRSEWKDWYNGPENQSETKKQYSSEQGKTKLIKTDPNQTHGV